MLMQRISRASIPANFTTTLNGNNFVTDQGKVQYIVDHLPIARTEIQIRQVFQILTSNPLPPNFDFLNINFQPVQQMATQVFVTDPYQGNINPGTSEGSKLFRSATQELDKENKIEISLLNAHLLLNQLKKDADAFGWGELFYGIPISATDKKDLFKNYQKITKEDMQKQASKTWGNKDATFADTPVNPQNIEDIDPTQDATHRPTFYRRVKSKMIVKWIKGYLKASDWDTLQNDSSGYTWWSATGDEMDGPTIIWLLLQSCSPSTRVGVTKLKDQMRSATSAQHKHNIKDLTDYMKTKYRAIIEKGQNHDTDDYVRDIYKALKTVPNPAFKSWVVEDMQ